MRCVFSWTYFSKITAVTPDMLLCNLNILVFRKYMELALYLY